MEIRTFASFSEHLKIIKTFLYLINCEVQQPRSRTHSVLSDRNK